MELFQTEEHYIVYDNEYSLWCNRKDGRLIPQPGSSLATAWNPICLGKVIGVIGKIQILKDGEWRLLLITNQKSVGNLRGHEVFCITKVALLPLTQNGHPEIDIEKCPLHHFGIKKTAKVIMAPLDGQKPFAKTFNALKSATQVKKKEVKEKEKHERRIIEEVHRMFGESDCFYYSPTGDLTNSIQRLYGKQKALGWDQRFFWNQHMLHDVLFCKNTDLASHWLIPVIQGCVQIRRCPINDSSDSSSEEQSGLTPDLSLAILSRRSKFRAGTRYRRRGIDENGACASFVETEQVVQTADHAISFVQVRGSVPVYWTQPGIKYRPPPRIEKDDEETKKAFQMHFEELLNIHKKVAIVTLLELEGREEGLGDAFMKHVVFYNSPNITYIMFDFHEHCRGLHFENVARLVDNIRHDVVKEMRYCWVDGHGTISEQQSVFRVNCMDCLDRTNVVQTAIAKVVLTTQLHKLGLLMPDDTLSPGIRRIFQEMWADNGDALSHQNTGTAALKGDFTRTGERKITGMMKDGYHSANRYLTAQFKDAYRQLAIDVLLGNKDTPEEKSLLADKLGLDEADGDDGLWTKEKEESIKLLVQHCCRLLIPKQEARVYLGGWTLINCDFRESLEDYSEIEDDIILLVTEKAYYIAHYDEAEEKITQYERIPMEHMEAITIGSATLFFGSSTQRCCRIHHTVGNESGYFITLKDLPEHSTKQTEGTLQGVVETFAIARAANNLGLKVVENQIDSKKSKSSRAIMKLTSQKRFTMWLQDKFVREGSTNKKESRPHNHAENPNVRPLKAQLMSRYLQNMGNKVSNFNLIKRIKSGKDLVAALKDGLDNKGFNEQQDHNHGDDNHGDDTVVDSDVILGEVEDDASSSTVTSSEDMSVGEYLDVLCSVEVENLLHTSMCKDGDVIVREVGDLATDPVRNERSFRCRGLTPNKRHVIFGTPEKLLQRNQEIRRNRSVTVHDTRNLPYMDSLEHLRNSGKTAESDAKKSDQAPDAVDAATTLADLSIKENHFSNVSPTKANLQISVTTEGVSDQEHNVALLVGTSSPKRSLHVSPSFPENLPLLSPIKSHSENNLTHYLNDPNASIPSDVSDSDVSSAGSGFKRITNHFKRFNLPGGSAKTQRQNEKLRKQLELRAKCQSRFICL